MMFCLVSYQTYRFLLGFLFLIWGSLNITHAWGLADNAEMNILKGIISFFIVIVYIFIRPRVVEY